MLADRWGAGSESLTSALGSARAVEDAERAAESSSAFMSVRLGPVFAPPNPGSDASGGFTENVPVPSTEFDDGASRSTGFELVSELPAVVGCEDICAYAGIAPMRAAKANAMTAGRGSMRIRFGHERQNTGCGDR